MPKGMCHELYHISSRALRPVQGMRWKCLPYHDQPIPQEAFRCVSTLLLRCCLCAFSSTAPVPWRSIRTPLSAPGKGSRSRMTKALISNPPNRQREVATAFCRTMHHETDCAVWTACGRQVDHRQRACPADRVEALPCAPHLGLGGGYFSTRHPLVSQTSVVPPLYGVC